MLVSVMRHRRHESQYHHRTNRNLGLLLEVWRVSLRRRNAGYIQYPQKLRCQSWAPPSAPRRNLLRRRERRTTGGSLHLSIWVTFRAHPISAASARDRERIAETLGLRGERASSAPRRRLRRFRRPLGWRSDRRTRTPAAACRRPSVRRRPGNGPAGPRDPGAETAKN
jgi:hypothetical protein